MTFTELGVSAKIIKGLDAQGFDVPTEIQTSAIPLVASGKDVIGLSHTGSGKTYAFGIPAIECVDDDSSTQVLIVCPTRELVMQETESLRLLTEYIDHIKIVPIFGGSSMDKQIFGLKRNSKIVIGTPGRLMDHLRRRTLKLNNLKMIILDEADEMLNMGFKDDIETILKSTPKERQTIMFSATMPSEILKLTNQYMKQPVVIKSKIQDRPQAFIKQFYTSCDKDKKLDTIKGIYKKFAPKVSIVFCNTKRMTEQLAASMTTSNLPAVCLHGDMRQSERRRAIENFKKNGDGILVATDVAARGIDIKNVDIIVNYDFPNNYDYYIHRIGRTGRAGKEGTAITIINTTIQQKSLQNLITKTGNKIEEFAIEGMRTAPTRTPRTGDRADEKRSSIGGDFRNKRPSGGRSRGEKPKSTNNFRKNSTEDTQQRERSGKNDRLRYGATKRPAGNNARYGKSSRPAGNQNRFKKSFGK